MTASTEQERAAYERELIDNHHYVPYDFSFKDGFYGGDDDYIQFGWDLWQAARRAPAVPVPRGWKITEEMHVAAVKVLHRASGVDGLPQQMVDAMLAAAPQPPEVAPVQLPEPSGVVVTTIGNYASVNAAPFVRKGDKLYTEKQVREILKSHGINVKKSDGE